MLSNFSPSVCPGEVTVTKTLKYLNQNNPLDKYTAYARTNNVRKEFTILDKEVFVSGVVNDMGNLLICVDENVGK